MQINATVLVQGFNFACAYILIRSLIVRPALDIIEAQERAQKQRIASQQDAASHVVLLETQRTQLWQSLSTYYQRRAPQTYVPFIPEKRLQETKSTQKHGSGASSQELARLIVDKVLS